MIKDVTPKISVIIPLYNKAPYIKRAIDSVLSQTIQDFEIIVVGGNSSDGGEEIVYQYSEPRIHFVKEQGQGVSLARNQGVREARADLVAFLDADDEWTPNFLETIFILREHYPNAGFYGTGCYINKNEKKSLCIYNENKGEQLIHNYFRAKNSYGDFIIITSAMVIPKKIFLSVGGFPRNYIQHEDRYLRARIALDYDVAYSPKICATYHLNYLTYSNRARKYVEEPFSKYVSENYDKIKNKSNIDDIIEFCDRGKNGVIQLNLESNRERWKVRKDIHSITSKRLQFKKYYLLVLSYMPPIMVRLQRVTITQIREIKEKFS